MPTLINGSSPFASEIYKYALSQMKCTARLARIMGIQSDPLEVVCAKGLGNIHRIKMCRLMARTAHRRRRTACWILLCNIFFIIFIFFSFSFLFLPFLPFLLFVCVWLLLSLYRPGLSRFFWLSRLSRMLIESSFDAEAGSRKVQLFTCTWTRGYITKALMRCELANLLPKKIST
ncbi:hypothetical protein L228DRAFT_4082 [Xylona heveae TC161]|uniref:Uncharacterized protein n=1 Tax=Xylona heveae (strain CBS 132557 / TC161) TaxID=1328760 RepID=A0A165JCK8_XYLHT|nr:hypothetical protein L228DRAFT_4082 [Xylona heveae TC161]KZF26057.1 hypothetical protein L228DRAFT_4082 [Xylona heveae TC161]